MGVENSVNYVLEKLREKGRDLGAENWMNYVMDKLNKWLVVVNNFGGSLIGKVDEVFPPKTREEQLRCWLKVATPFIISAVVLLLCICYSRRRRGKAVKMMNAPGGRRK